jgi:hypothetical protein
MVTTAIRRASSAGLAPARPCWPLAGLPRLSRRPGGRRPGVRCRGRPCSRYRETEGSATSRACGGRTREVDPPWRAAQRVYGSGSQQRESLSTPPRFIHRPDIPPPHDHLPHPTVAPCDCAPPSPAARRGTGPSPLARGGTGRSPLARGGTARLPLVRGGTGPSPLACGGTARSPAVAPGGTGPSPLARGCTRRSPLARGGAARAPAAAPGGTASSSAWPWQSPPRPLPHPPRQPSQPQPAPPDHRRVRRPARRLARRRAPGVGSGDGRWRGGRR